MSEPEKERLLVTVRHAAERLTISTSSVYRLIERGELSALKIGRSVRIYKDSLDKYLNGPDRPRAA